MTSDRVFDSPYQWNLYGSEGRTSLGGNFLRIWRPSKRGNELILAEIAIKNLWLNRSSEKISYHNLPTDFTVTLSQVVMSRQRIEELIEDLDHWIEMPIEISKPLHPPDQNEQEIGFNFRLPDIHRKLAKPRFEVEYSGIAFPTGKWCFLLDQSCIRIFVSELRNALETLGRAA
jgi:hypothetical protein